MNTKRGWKRPLSKNIFKLLRSIVTTSCPGFPGFNSCSSQIFFTRIFHSDFFQSQWTWKKVFYEAKISFRHHHHIGAPKSSQARKPAPAKNYGPIKALNSTSNSTFSSVSKYFLSKFYASASRYSLINPTFIHTCMHTC